MSYKPVLECTQLDLLNSWLVSQTLFQVFFLDFKFILKNIKKKVVSVNRLCSSGLESCAIVAAKIKNNIFDMALAGGVENMSMYDMNCNIFVICKKN